MIAPSTQNLRHPNTKSYRESASVEREHEYAQPCAPRRYRNSKLYITDEPKWVDQIISFSEESGSKQV
jgi:hypothetical protein